MEATKTSSGIPLRIHQTWKTRDLPPYIDRCFESVGRLNPGWERRLYTDDDLEQVVEGLSAVSANPDMLSVDEFRQFPSGVEKADIFRCAILYLKGGIYCDMDIEAIRPFDDLLAKAEETDILQGHTDLLLTTDHDLHCAHLYGRPIYMNHFMAAKPGSRFLEAFLCQLSRSWRERNWGPGENPVWTTGPGVMTHLLERAGDLNSLGVGIFPSRWVNPLPDMASSVPGKERHDEMIRNAMWRKELEPYAVHYWWHNYCGAPCLFEMYGDLLFEDPDSMR